MKAFANAASAALGSTSTPSAAASPPFPFPRRIRKNPRTRLEEPGSLGGGCDGLAVAVRLGHEIERRRDRSSRAATLSAPPGT